MTSVSRLLCGLALIALTGASARADEPTHRNVLIFVADGLRSGMVTDETAPTMARIRKLGVDLRNSHAMYPTVTTPNASAIATGHRLGDTGDFGNILYVGKQTNSSSPSPFANVEDDDTLMGLNAAYQGNFLGQESLMAAARRAGYATALVGKTGPISVQDVTQRDGQDTVVVDDGTGYPGIGSIPLAPDVAAAIKAAGLPTVAEDRGLNGSPGTFNMAGVLVANVQQQDWFVGVATKAVLPRLAASGKPFMMVFWSRDPDGTQHFQGDSLNSLKPGINGKTSLAAIRNADNDLAALLAKLHELGLDANTDVVVLADHGFSTVSKQSHTSAAAKLHYPDVIKGQLPQGFLAEDMAAWLQLPLFDGFGLPVAYRKGEHPKGDSAVIGADPAKPDIAVAANGGSDLIYLPSDKAKTLAPKIVAWLTRQDTTGAIFTNDAFGQIPGAIPMSRISLIGTARTPQPSIVVSFRSFSTGCDTPDLCAVEVADVGYQQGQGIHGSFSRGDTHNFMAAIGPDFKAGYVDPAPVSNADVAPTLAKIMGLEPQGHGDLRGRPMTEALAGGAEVTSASFVEASKPAANGFTTVLDGQTVGDKRYFDAAGAPGKMVGVHR